MKKREKSEMAQTLRQIDGRPREFGEEPRRELKKPRRNMLSIFGSVGTKIEAQKSIHQKKRTTTQLSSRKTHQESEIEKIS